MEIVRSWCAALGSLALLVIATASGAKTPSLGVADLNLVSGCNIYLLDGTLVSQFPGNICLFLEDGRLISATSTHLAMLGRDRSEVWKLPGHYHHQLNWSLDKKHFLALSSEIIQVSGEARRSDILRKIDLNGKIVAEIGAQRLFETLHIESRQMPFDWDMSSLLKAKNEISHFNSIYEIPPLKKASKVKGIEAGNIIASSLEAGAVILSPDFLPIAKIEFSRSQRNSIHDVQVTSDGEILYFNNFLKDDKTNPERVSTVEIMNPQSQKAVYTFMSTPPEMFFSSHGGGAQEVGSKHLLVSHGTAGFFFIEKKTNKVMYGNILSDKKSMWNLKFSQQARVENVKKFLKQWGSL